MTEFLWLLPFAIPILGYAETHFRLPFFPNRLFKREPEIIFDMPVRTEPGSALPVFLLINDAHLFPIRVDSVSINCYHLNSGEQSFFSFPVHENIAEPFYERQFHVLLAKPGKWEIKAELSGFSENKPLTVISDNYSTTQKKPFTVWIGSDRFPKFENQQHGDIHHHTRYTFDQVEFGGGIQLSKAASVALAYDFLCLTDHSYDLDDLPDNYLKQDPELRKWKQLIDEVISLNQPEEGTLLIPGFELSTRNESGKNIHLLLLGQRTFIHGSGDSGERPFRTKSETSLKEALSLLNQQTTAYAAHPFEVPSSAERFALNRGIYSETDLLDTQIPMQILNGWLGEAFQKSRKIWIEFLVSGNRTFIGGGNDSHGNFNRVRQTKLPFFSLTEKDSHWFGKFRTVVQTAGKDEERILSALKAGHSYLTNGIALHIFRKDLSEVEFGTDLKREDFNSLELELKTTEEFGCLEKIRLFIGADGKELITNLEIGQQDCLYFRQEFTDFRLPDESLYFRIEVEGKLAEFYHQRSPDLLVAFTNPVFLI